MNLAAADGIGRGHWYTVTKAGGTLLPHLRPVLTCRPDRSKIPQGWIVARGGVFPGSAV